VEIKEFNYADAMMNCKKQFGFENTGKLFEPRDSSTNTQVLESAYLISPSSFHIGINDRGSEGTPVLYTVAIFSCSFFYIQIF
jgi:hypothetical protein